MPASNSLKGLRNLKTLHTKKKENQSNFLKLYILDKERMRLRNEQIRLNLRLEIINDRLKEIEAFSSSVLETEETPKKETNTEESNENEGQQFNTVSFEY